MKANSDTKNLPATTVRIPPGTDFNCINEEAGSKVNKNAQIKTESKISSFEIISNYVRDIRRNEITHSLEIDQEVQTEQHINSLYIQMTMDFPHIAGLTKQKFETFLNSNYIPTYNPIKNFFESNGQQSKTGLIESLINSLNVPLNKDLEKHSTGFTQKVITWLFTRWLVGIVASLYDFNYNCLMLILIGPKGCGKSEFFRRLLPNPLLHYFAQSKFDAGKDDSALMCENLLILNDELDGLNAKEAKTFRNFVSTSFYSYRPPYARQNVKRKRLASVCGTSNEKDVINDPDNNRRIIPIEIFGVDHQLYNSVNKRELFLEAFHLYKSGFGWDLTKKEMMYLDVLAEGHGLPSLEEELLQKYFSRDNGTEELTASDVKEAIDKISGQKLSLNKVGRALRAMQFPCAHKKVNGRTHQFYTCSRTPGEVNDLL